MTSASSISANAAGFASLLSATSSVTAAGATPASTGSSSATATSGGSTTPTGVVTGNLTAEQRAALAAISARLGTDAATLAQQLAANPALAQLLAPRTATGRSASAATGLEAGSGFLFDATA